MKLELPLANAWAARTQSVDAALERFLPQPPECPVRLARAMHHAVFPGGKRLRPVLTLMVCEAAGGDQTLAIEAACAVELVHCYSLVHDDLPAMDDDDLRRGRPTVHKAFDEGTAILAGDALLTLAFELLARSELDAAAVTECVRELAVASGAAGMVGGQMDDLLGADTTSDPDALLSRLHSVHARKTGALLLASVRLGAIAAQAPAAIRNALDRYGRCLGLAFQITDDLLDVSGNEEQLGKRVGKYQHRGKLTFPGLLGVERAAHEARRLASEACQALHPLGTAAESLCTLSQDLIERNC